MLIMSSPEPVHLPKYSLLGDEVVLEDVQHADHLREDEHPVSLRLQLRQQLVYQHQLAGALYHRLRGTDGQRSDSKRNRGNGDDARLRTPGSDSRHQHSCPVLVIQNTEQVTR